MRRHDRTPPPDGQTAKAATLLIHQRWRQAIEEGDWDGADQLTTSVWTLNHGMVNHVASVWCRVVSPDEREEIRATAALAFMYAWSTWDPEKGKGFYGWFQWRANGLISRMLAARKNISQIEMRDRWEQQVVARALGDHRGQDIPPAHVVLDPCLLEPLFSAQLAADDIQIAIKKQNTGVALHWLFDTIASHCGTVIAADYFAHVGLADKTWRIVAHQIDDRRGAVSRSRDNAKAIVAHPTVIGTFLGILEGTKTPPPIPVRKDSMPNRHPTLNMAEETTARFIYDTTRV